MNRTLRCPDGLTLLTGGVRSGKSSLAERLAGVADRPVVFVATATAGDADMADRIRRHKAARPIEWATIEEPSDLAGAVGMVDDGHALIIDCLTLWVTNLLLDDASEQTIVDRASAVVTLLARRRGPTIVVTNEVGMGIVPANELSRRFRDTLGRTNAVVAEHARQVWLVAAGRVLPLVAPEDLS